MSGYTNQIIANLAVEFHSIGFQSGNQACKRIRWVTQILQLIAVTTIIKFSFE
jgi:hypothetical protein